MMSRATDALSTGPLDLVSGLTPAMAEWPGRSTETFDDTWSAIAEDARVSRRRIGILAEWPEHYATENNPLAEQIWGRRPVPAHHESAYIAP